MNIFTEMWALGFALQEASLVAETVKNMPTMWETLVCSLGWEDPLEESLATHSNILTWRIPIDRGAWPAAVHGVHKELDTTERLTLSLHKTQNVLVRIMNILYIQFFIFP